MNMLKYYRTQKGLTALELHLKTGIGEQQVFNLERGRYLPSATAAAHIAAVLDVPVLDIFPDLAQARRVRL